ncbi:MAG: HAMP domain-containing histidine kinase [Nitrospirae bacterium]|nr:HAMP domain-containing histidine kinase [Nitrospirota bacterium]
MRTKLFLSFILIIFLALLSNVVFERLTLKDFDEFVRGTKEDQIYWVLASIEGSYVDNQWDMEHLSMALHWGLMLGFETYVDDTSGEKILSSTEVLLSLNPNMFKRMLSILKLPTGEGKYVWYPLYIKGREVGKLYVRPLKRLGAIALKEDIFRNRGREFLITSFLIAGGGAIFLSVLFTIYLSTPVRRLNSAAEKIAKGDLSVKIPPLHRPFGSLYSALKCHDEMDRLTDTFNYMAEALRREDSLRKHLTSNVAHELRTPLAIIRVNLEAIEDGIITDTHTVINNINSEIQRLISLVEGIEDITRAEASFFKKGPQTEIDLKEFIETITSGMAKMIEEKGLFIKTEGPRVTVKTYPEKLHIILKNLLTNAYKFTHSGGITIRWDKYKKDGGTTGFHITVEDSGKGIVPGNISKVFERFYKGKDSGGRGLGLAIVKELTEVTGGRIEVESTPDIGSRFTVTF